MPLTWDISEVKDFEDLYEEVKGEKELNVITSTIIHITQAIGMNQITKENVKNFYIRCKQIEVAYGMKGFILITDDWTTRNPTLPELQAHIGLRTNADTITNRKWGSELKRHVELTAKDLMAMEQEEEQDNEM